MNFPFECSNIPATPHAYISFSWYDIPELVFPDIVALNEGQLLLTRNVMHQ